MGMCIVPAWLLQLHAGTTHNIAYVLKAAVIALILSLLFRSRGHNNNLIKTCSTNDNRHIYTVLPGIG